MKLGWRSPLCIDRYWGRNGLLVWVWWLTAAAIARESAISEGRSLGVLSFMT